MSSRTPAKIIVISNTSGGNSSKRFRAVTVLNTVFARSLSLSRNWVLGISLHERVTHLLCLRLEFSEATLVITNFKLRKDGVVKRLPCFDQMVEDAGKFVGRVLDGL